MISKTFLGVSRPESTNFVKLKENFGNIKFATCGDYNTVIVNDKSELFITGYFDGKSTDCFVKILDLNNYFNEFKFIRVAKSRSLIIVCGNAVYGMGDNTFGQLGLDIPYCKDLSKIFDGHVKDLQCGNTHIVLLDKFECVFVAGSNDNGELGLNDNIQRNRFTLVDLPFKVKKIYCKQKYTYLLNEYGDIYVTGENAYGQLGLGDTQNRFTFTKIELNEKVKYILCEYNFSILCSHNNNLYVCGCNWREKLGVSEDVCKRTQPHNIPYLDVFTKLELEITERYVYPIVFCEKIYCVTSDSRLSYYKDCEEPDIFNMNCFNSLKRRNLVDIIFVNKF
ncbi:hypothetical protein ABK040_012393 [Willaertia magna]